MRACQSGLVKGWLKYIFVWKILCCCDLYEVPRNYHMMRIFHRRTLSLHLTFTEWGKFTERFTTGLSLMSKFFLTIDNVMPCRSSRLRTTGLMCTHLPNDHLSRCVKVKHWTYGLWKRGNNIFTESISGNSVHLFVCLFACLEK